MSDIITYPENGITYDAEDAAGYLATRQSGVYSADEDFSVTASSDLTVTVSAGHAWVRPARFRGRSIIMEQPATLTLTAADPVRSRIDCVVLRYDAAAKKTSLTVLEGTPDSASPAAPAITRTALVYDLCLAQVKRTAGSTAVTSADLTDTRLDEELCGIMRDGVTGIPTAQLLEQWNAVQAAQTASGQKLLDELEDSIAKVDRGSFYTKTEADNKFGTPYTLPAATADTLGGVKVGAELDIAADGTISAETLAAKIQAVAASNYEPRLVWTTDVSDAKKKTTFTGSVPDGVDYVYVKPMVMRYNSTSDLTVLSIEVARGQSKNYVSDFATNYDDKHIKIDLTFSEEGVLTITDKGGYYSLNKYEVEGYHYLTYADILEQIDSVSTDVTALQTAQEDTDALLVDQEYRLTLLELGVE